MYKASIILACYNKEKYIRRALESLISLSRFEDFEIIIVDDCSTDQSVKIVSEFADRYPNISLYVLPQGSGSPSRPRNTGIAKSTSEYLIFMDPDDMVINDGYSILLDKAEEYGSDLIIAARVGVNDAGVRQFVDFIDSRFTYVNEKSDIIALDLLNRRPFILKTIYKKKMLEDAGIRFNEKICTSEDEAFDMRCVAAATTITKINDIVYQYTVEAEDSITTKVSLRLYRDFYNVLVELVSSYKCGFSDAIVAERIVRLLNAFYITKLAFLSSPDEVDEACGLIYAAFDKFGYELFDSLIARTQIDLMEAVKRKDLSFYVKLSFLRRIRNLQKARAKEDRRSSKAIAKLEKKNEKLQSKLGSTKKKLEEVQKLQNRRVVRPAVKLAKAISSSKKTKKALLEKKSRCDGPIEMPPVPKDEAVDVGAERMKRLSEFISRSDDSPNGYWLFSDRITDAKDNGEALYRYVMRQGVHNRIAFILSSSSKDYDRLVDEGFNIVEWDSLEHWNLLKNCEYLFCSHCDSYVLEPWFCIEKKAYKPAIKKYSINPSYKLVFLQHGVLRKDMSGWLGSKNFYRIVASSPIEKNSLVGIPSYRLSEDHVSLVGLPRWDYLKNEAKDEITIFPTWRPELISLANSGSESDAIKQTPFFSNWISFCKSRELKELSRGNVINFVCHADNSIFADLLEKEVGADVNVVPYSSVGSFSRIVNRSKMLITDYSSFSFDFLYEKKPVLYFDFDADALRNNYRGMEYGKYGYYCTTLSEALSLIASIAERDFKLDDERDNAIDMLLPYRNSDHCKRLMEEIVASR